MRHSETMEDASLIREKTIFGKTFRRSASSSVGQLQRKQVRQLLPNISFLWSTQHPPVSHCISIITMRVISKRSFESLSSDYAEPTMKAIFLVHQIIPLPAGQSDLLQSWSPVDKIWLNLQLTLLSTTLLDYYYFSFFWMRVPFSFKFLRSRETSTNLDFVLAGQKGMPEAHWAIHRHEVFQIDGLRQRAVVSEEESREKFFGCDVWWKKSLGGQLDSVCWYP